MFNLFVLSYKRVYKYVVYAMSAKCKAALNTYTHTSVLHVQCGILLNFSLPWRLRIGLERWPRKRMVWYRISAAAELSRKNR